MIYLINFLFASACLRSVYSSNAPWNYNGSTPSLESIITGRCHEFQVLNLENRLPDLTIEVHCMKFWDNFTDIFAYQDPCKFNFTDKYKDIIKAVDNGKLLKDKVKLRIFLFVYDSITFNLLYLCNSLVLLKSHY